MPRFTAPFLTLLLGGALAAGLVACGEEDAKLLPGETAREITANLDTVQQLADEGDCEGSEDAARQVREQVEALTGVDAKLLRALSEGAERLGEVVASCAPEASEETTEETVPTITESEPAKPPKKEKEKKPKEKPEKEKKEPEDAQEEEAMPTTPATPPSEATPTPPSAPPAAPPPGGTGAPPGGLSPEGEEGEG